MTRRRAQTQGPGESSSPIFLVLNTLALLAFILSTVTFGWHWPSLSFDLFGYSYEYPLQLFSWAIVSIYSLAASRIEQTTFRAMFAKTSLFFIFSQLVVALADSWTSGILFKQLGSTRPYYFYSLLYVFSTLIASLISLGIFTARTSSQGRTASAVLFFVIQAKLLQYSQFGVAACLAVSFAGGYLAGHFFPRNFRMRDLFKKFVQFRTRHRKLEAMGIFAIASLVRIAWGVHLIQSTGDKFLLTSDDGQTYHHLALLMMKGADASQFTWTYGGYAYSFLLSRIYLIFGTNFYAVTLIQGILGGLGVLAVYLTGRMMFGSFVGIFAGLIAALNTNSILYSVFLGMEAVFLPALFWMVYAFAWCIKTDRIKKPKWGLFLGLICGAVYILRIQVAGVPLLFALCIALAWKKGRLNISLSTALAVVSLFWLGMGMGLLGQAMINFRYLGRFSASTSQAAVCFAFPIYGFKELSDKGFNPFASLPAAWSFFLENPKLVLADYILAIPSRLLHFFICPTFGQFDPVFLLKPYGALRMPYNSLLEWYSILAAFIGTWTACRRKDKSGAFACVLALYVLYSGFINAMIFAGGVRYIAPVLPMIFMAIGLGIQSLFNRACESARR